MILSIFDRKRYVCRTVFKKVSFFIACFQKSVITTVKGYKVISPGKEGTEPMEKSQELIGILQAISIVAKSLAAKLMQIEKEVEAYEAAKAAAQERKAKKGWRR